MFLHPLLGAEDLSEKPWQHVIVCHVSLGCAGTDTSGYLYSIILEIFSVILLQLE
jgi:hypothetical protein